jgi:16S rRNA (adenine1518-N6/adenine1519-N6)-dimethyltransferase
MLTWNSGMAMLERNQIYLRPVKTLGQNFLVNEDIAKAEAEYAEGKNVLEMGPGYGILTKNLCDKAKRVVAVEIDRNLFAMLRHKMKYNNLKLINKDFFKASDEEMGLGDTDIMIANVPYKFSSKVIDFLLEHDLQAVLCLQKEFVEHMTALPGSKNYSRLSVMFSLCFSYTKLVAVPKGSFRPIPKVDSMVVYVKPKSKVRKEEADLINAMMQHKKKRVKNAIMDSRRYFSSPESELQKMVDSIENKESRLFKLTPEEILNIAKKLSAGKSS